MNNLRRKQLNTIIEALQDLHLELEDIMNEEEDYRDNIPDNLQGSEKYEKADEAVSNLEAASDYFDELISYIEDAKA